MLTVGLDLAVHPQKETVLALETIHLDVVDLNSNNDLEDQCQGQLVDTVENILRSNIDQLQSPLVNQVIEARLQILTSLESELRILGHTTKA